MDGVSLESASILIVSFFIAKMSNTVTLVAQSAGEQMGITIALQGK